MNKKVSIVVPCHNVREYIDMCMESLLNQTIGLENLEIILVDDASTDDGATLKRLEQYEQKFSDNIILIPLEENLRQGGARNVGIQYASGEYLMFCDADDYLSLCAAERLYNAAQMYQADVVEFNMKKIRDYDEIDATLVSGENSCLIDLSDTKVRRAVLDMSRTDFGLGCVPKCYRLSMIQDNNIRFAEHMIYEEPSFTVPVRLYENRHLYLDEVLYYYIQRPESTMYAKKTEHYLDSMKVWNVLMDDLLERGMLKTYYWELSKMYYDWAFLLTLNILHTKGENISGEIFHELKDNVEARFPDIRQNPLFADEQGQKEIAIVDIDYTQEKQGLLERLLDDCLVTL